MSLQSNGMHQIKPIYSVSFLVISLLVGTVDGIPLSISILNHIKLVKGVHVYQGT